MDLLKGVKYIFQIPLEWFRRVDARVFGDHPGPGVRFDDAMDGSRAIGIDYHVLDDRYDGSGGAERPETTTSLVDNYPGTATASTGSWTADGRNGLVVTKLTRVYWSGTQLYGFYRKFTYDKGGRLYSVSGETRYTIETPVAYTGS